MIEVSVKDIVRFVYQSGDLQSELALGRDQLGSKLHRQIQATYHEHDQAEVAVQTIVTVLGERFLIRGRMDGLLDNQRVLEEIKSTGEPLDSLSFDSFAVHGAQAKMYAYMHLLAHPNPSMVIQLTYISVQSEQLTSFQQVFSFEDLESFFFATMETFASWMLERHAHRELVMEQTTSVVFPFARRASQDRFMNGVYQTLKQHDILYAVAPTGTGKTMGALFAGLKAKDPEDTLFYLTAKNSHKQLAMESMATLSAQGLQAITVALTAKDHICFLEERDCDPKVCPFAKGYFDKLQGALDDSFALTNHFTKEVIEAIATDHQVCPFELSLDLSTYADVVVCDYNYVFDPKARLVRYFETDRPVRLLIDEAHNMVSRSKSMYSATLDAAELQPLLATTIKRPIKTAIQHVLNQLNQPSYDAPSLPIGLIQAVQRAFDLLSDMLLNAPQHPERRLLLKGMFHLLDFRRIVNLVNDAYHVIHDQTTQQTRLVCLNAKDHLQPLLMPIKGTILFSATLDPLPYYQAFLTEQQGKVLRVDSPFAASQVQTLLIDFVPVRYQQRTATIQAVASYVHALKATGKNTICFAPSYDYIELLAPHLPADTLLQQRLATLEERDALVARFRHEQGLLGVFVVGGVFAEGVDYLGTMLEQLLIIGVGMPGVDIETNKTKEYFDQHGVNGFDYAYRYPGIAKIIQAAGRLIRSTQDQGIVVFLDDRFKDPFYPAMIPSFYGTPKRVRDLNDFKTTIQTFWQNKGMS